MLLDEESRRNWEIMCTSLQFRWQRTLLRRSKRQAEIWRANICDCVRKKSHVADKATKGDQCGEVAVSRVQEW